MTRRNEKEFYLERMQPNWYSGNRLALRFLDKLIGLLFIGLFAGIPSGLVGWLVVGSGGGWIAGLAVGLVVGVLLGVTGNNAETMFSAEELTWSWESFRKGLKDIQVLKQALGLGAFAGLIGEISVEWYKGQGAGLASGLGIVLAVGGCWLLKDFIGWGFRGKQLKNRNVVPPNQMIWRYARNGLVIGACEGFVLGLVVGGSVAVLVSFRSQIVTGLQLGVVAGAICWLGIGLSQWLFCGLFAWIEHFALRFLLWRVGVMPWRYVRFLDYSADCILLRKVGGGYIFVHRLLQDYFAALHAKPPGPSGA